MLFKVDAFAQKAYTKEEFIQHYDGLKEWDSLDYLDTSALEGDLCCLGRQNVKDIFDLFDYEDNYEDNGKLGHVGTMRLASLVVGKNIIVMPDVNGDIMFPAFFEWTHCPDLERIVEDDSKSDKLYDGEKIHSVISLVKEKVTEKGTSIFENQARVTRLNLVSCLKGGGKQSQQKDRAKQVGETVPGVYYLFYL
eukprot:g3304.t1